MKNIYIFCVLKRNKIGIFLKNHIYLLYFIFRLKRDKARGKELNS